jgi:hypothetical protein
VNFIETYFGISPVGGDSWLEILFLTLLAMIAVAIGLDLPLGKKKKK